MNSLARLRPPHSVHRSRKMVEDTAKPRMTTAQRRSLFRCLRPAYQLASAQSADALVLQARRVAELCRCGSVCKTTRQLSRRPLTSACWCAALCACARCSLTSVSLQRDGGAYDGASRARPEVVGGPALSRKTGCTERDCALVAFLVATKRSWPPRSRSVRRSSRSTLQRRWTVTSRQRNVLRSLRRLAEIHGAAPLRR